MKKSKLGIALLVLGGAMLLGVVPVSAQNALVSQKSVQANAATLTDHQQLANHYRAKAQEAMAGWVEQQDLVNYWGQKLWMQSRLKLPNPYWSAKIQAASRRAEWERYSWQAAEQEKIVKSLQRTPPRP